MARASIASGSNLSGAIGNRRGASELIRVGASRVPQSVGDNAATVQRLPLGCGAKTTDQRKGASRHATIGDAQQYLIRLLHMVTDGDTQRGVE